MYYMKSLINLFKEHFYFRQHPETAIRYAPIVKLINENNWQDLNIVEIGSGSYGITPYLKKSVTGIDTDFSEPKYNLLKQVRGTGEKLPFKNKEFDICIISDVLEHVDSKLRNNLIIEAIRVTSIAVIISGPFGEESFKQDISLSKFSSHHFFNEHIKFGLPDERDIENIKHPRISEITKIGSFFNLQYRYILMKLFVSKRKILYYFYLKGLMPFVGIFTRLNNPPQYRSVYLIRLK